MISLQERMSQALRHSGKKPSALARYLGISESAISQWVNGPTKTVNSTLVIKAAHFLGVSAFWFSTGEGNMLQMGGNEDRVPYSTNSKKEMVLLDKYRQLSRAKQVRLHDFLDGLLPKTK